MPQRELPIKGQAETTATIYTDGASRGNPGHASLGVVIKKKGHNVETLHSYLGILTNNQAEYSALVAALKRAQKTGLKSIRVLTDSLLLANQINGLWKVKDHNIKDLYVEVKALAEPFDSFSIAHIPREQNSEADGLANLALDDYLKNKGE